MKLSTSPSKKIIPQNETRENMLLYVIVLCEPNNVDDKYNINASIDQITKREIDIDINALTRMLKSATKEVPLQQLFSQVNKLVPPTTIKNVVIHVGSDFILSKFSFDGNNIKSGFTMQSPRIDLKNSKE